MRTLKLSVFFRKFSYCIYVKIEIRYAYILYSQIQLILLDNIIELSQSLEKENIYKKI